jgi:RNA polymerase sigma-70 factor (ECF subfamily)
VTVDQILTSAFIAALPRGAVSAAGDAPPLPPEFEGRLAEVVAIGRAAWPGLEVSPATFAAFLGARSDVALRGLQVADLYLACACAERVPGALEAFDRHVGSAVAAFVRAVDPAPELLEEVSQSLKDKLFVGAPDRPARIGAYLGQGPLAAWVGVAAQRTALSLLRGETALARAHKRAWAKEPDLANDPELAHLKVRYKGVFEAAFRDAFRVLAARDRTILSLHLLSGLTLERVGAIYRVNASTIHRWLDRARATLLTETERLLQERLQVSSKEFVSLARLVGSQLDFSVASLLREDAGRSTQTGKLVRR